MPLSTPGLKASASRSISQCFNVGERITDGTGKMYKITENLTALTCTVQEIDSTGANVGSAKTLTVKIA